MKCLHQAGELDNHLRLLVRDDDSDVEDEEKMAAKSVPNAGTEKRNDYYPNRVSLGSCVGMSLSNCLVVIWNVCTSSEVTTWDQSEWPDLRGGPISGN